MSSRCDKAHQISLIWSPPLTQAGHIWKEADTKQQALSIVTHGNIAWTAFIFYFLWLHFGYWCFSTSLIAIYKINIAWNHKLKNGRSRCCTALWGRARPDSNLSHIQRRSWSLIFLFLWIHVYNNVCISLSGNHKQRCCTALWGKAEPASFMHRCALRPCVNNTK